MASRIGVATVVIAFLAIIAAPLKAVDNITRKTGKALSGEVTSVSKTEVTIKVTSPKADTIKVPANEILNLTWTGEPADLNVARSDEAGGRLQKALEGYQKSLTGNKSSNANLKIDIEYFIARTTARQALVDATRVDEAIKKLDEFRARQGDHYRFFEAQNLLGQLHLSRKDFIKAQLAFDSLGKAPWKDFQMQARNATARLLMAENKLDEATAAFEAVIDLPAEAPLEVSQRQEALLGKSRVQIQQRKFDDALKLLAEIVKNVDPEEKKVMAEAYLRQGDCLRELGKDKEAVLAYLSVDVLFPTERPLHAEALFHLARLWEKVGHKARSLEARDKLESDYKDSEWTRQLKAPAA